MIVHLTVRYKKNSDYVPRPVITRSQEDVLLPVKMFFNAAEILSAVFVTTLAGWYLYYRYCFTYWHRKGLKTVPPVFPAGNITASILGRQSLYVKLQDIYREFKAKGERHAGLYFFNGPVYFPIDPDLIKKIFVTDFDHFVDRGTYFDEEKHPLSAHLFSITGNRWRTLRTKLSPTFTSGKLKAMFDGFFVKKAENLVRTLASAGDRDVNVKKLMNGFTTDVIAASAFGMEANTLQEPNSEFARTVANIFHPPAWLFVKTVLEEGFQNPGNIIKAMHVHKETEVFFKKIVDDSIRYRTGNDVVRNDFLSLLMEARDQVGLSPNEMVAQSFLMFLGGFETSSATISFCLHELAHSQELQERLREEIRSTIGEDVSRYKYEDVLKLPYLDKVVKETLRLYPVVGVFNRICVKTYKVPGTDVTLDPGTPVLISSLGLQRDPDYFPDPLKFDPERFGDRDSQVPFTYLPFGEGPRICIGMRYGQLQTKLGVAAAVANYKFFPSAKTPKYIEFDKMATSLVMSKKEGMFLKVVKI